MGAIRHLGAQGDDDETWKAGFAAGTKLAGDKGHFEISYSHYSDRGILFKSDRDYYRLSLVGSNPTFPLAVAGTAANPFTAANNVTNPQNTFGGLITNGALKGQTFDQNGVLSPFVHGVATGTATAEIGGSGSYSGGESLKAPLRYDQLFIRLDYDLPASMHFHTEVAAIDKTDTTLLQRRDVQ